MLIASVEVRAVGDQHGWNFYSDDVSLRSTLTICRIRTNCGAEGVGGVTQYGEHAFDATTATNLVRHLAPKLIGRDPAMREEITASLACGVYPAAPHSTAAVDIALWDPLGNVSGVPLYVLLGGSRSFLPVQWSSPSFQTVPEYLTWCDEALESGCRRLKIHGFMSFERDKALVREVKRHVDAYFKRKRRPPSENAAAAAPATLSATAAAAPATLSAAVGVPALLESTPRSEEGPQKVYLSLDCECLYAFDDAKRMATLLAELDYDWFEGPLPDRDFGLYADLTRRSSVDILPGGNQVADLQSFAQGCQRGCWSRARFDVTVCGGITQAKKYFAVAEAHGIRTEIQSWGHTLTAAANLHVMLGLGGTRHGSSHFELAVPKEIYEVGMKDKLTFAPFATADPTVKGGGRGRGVGVGEPVVRAPNREDGLPGGLGVRVDWEEMDRLAFFNETVTADTQSMAGDSDSRPCKRAKEEGGAGAR